MDEEGTFERRQRRRMAIAVGVAGLLVGLLVGAAGGEEAGLNCSEIGHSFNVAPGSDPDHDADNDGIACESY